MNTELAWINWALKKGYRDWCITTHARFLSSVSQLILTNRGKTYFRAPILSLQIWDHLSGTHPDARTAQLPVWKLAGTAAHGHPGRRNLGLHGALSMSFRPWTHLAGNNHDPQENNPTCGSFSDPWSLDPLERIFFMITSFSSGRGEGPKYPAYVGPTVAVKPPQCRAAKLLWRPGSARPIWAPQLGITW